MERSTKDTKDLVVYGTPDGGAQRRLVRALAEGCLEHYRGEGSRVLSCDVSALLLGPAYGKAYSATSEAFSCSGLTKGECWLSRHLWVDSMISDLRAEVQSLRDSALAFVIPTLDEAIDAIVSREKEWLTCGHNLYKSHAISYQPPATSGVEYDAEGLTWFSPLYEHLKALKLRPVKMFTQSARVVAGDPSQLSWRYSVGRLPENDILWLASQVLGGTGAVHTSGGSGRCQSICLDTVPEEGRTAKDLAIRLVRRVRNSFKAPIARQLVLAWEDSINNLVDEPKLSRSDCVESFFIDCHLSNRGWLTESVSNSLGRGTDPLGPFIESTKRLEAKAAFLRSHMQRASSLQAEMRASLEAHPELEFLLTCSEPAMVLPALMEHTLLDAGKLPELLLVLQDAAAKGERDSSGEDEDHDGYDSSPADNNLRYNAPEMLSVLLEIMPHVNDPLFRKQAMAEANRMATAFRKKQPN